MVVAFMGFTGIVAFMGYSEGCSQKRKKEGGKNDQS